MHGRGRGGGSLTGPLLAAEALEAAEEAQQEEPLLSAEAPEAAEEVQQEELKQQAAERRPGAAAEQAAERQKVFDLSAEDSPSERPSEEEDDEAPLTHAEAVPLAAAEPDVEAAMGHQATSDAAAEAEEAAIVHQVSRRERWKSLRFHTNHARGSKHGHGHGEDQHHEDYEHMSFRRNVLRHPDEDFFIDVLSVFEYLVPGWADASIDSQGLLDFHGGSASRIVPFLAILLVVPAYLLLPVVGLRHLLERDEDIHAADRLLCLLRLAMMGWFAWAPVLYWASGTVSEDVGRGETSFLIVFFPWWALAWFGYEVANKNLLEACDNAVEVMKAEVNNRALFSDAGDFALRAFIEALTSPTDPGSLYPMFVSSEDDEPHYEPLGVVPHLPIVGLVAVHVAYTLYPVFLGQWCAWSLVMNFTSAAAIGYAAYTFCYDLAQKMADFKDCLDQVRVFLFLVSPPEIRKSRRRREEYLKLVQNNAQNRQSLTHTKTHQKIGRPNKEYRNKLRRKFTINASGVLAPREELPLDIRRVEVDLSTISGVSVLQHLHGWVCADIVNERFGIDTSASLLVVMLLLLLGVAVTPLIVHTVHHVSLTQTVALVDILAMLCYIGLTCNCCVQMNELLFENSDRILLMWKDHARNPQKTLGRVMLNDQEREFPSDVDENAVPSIYQGPLEVRAMIDITRETLFLQEPQQILGMKVTPALRAKLLSTLATGLVAVAISMLKKHFGEQ